MLSIGNPQSTPTVPTPSPNAVSGLLIAPLEPNLRTDFNNFREASIQAIDILDQKIRDILAVTEPTCIQWR